MGKHFSTIFILPILLAMAVSAKAESFIISSHSISGSDVTLNWSGAPAAQRGKNTYSIWHCVGAQECQPNTNAISTKSLYATVVGLTQGETYWFEIRARDAGGNVSVSNPLYPVTVVSGGTGGGTGGGGTGGGGTGGGGTGECDYPAFSDPPGGEGYVKFVKPDWLKDQSTPDLVFSDEFDGSGDTWILDDMHDPLNQSGNLGIDSSGDVCPKCRPAGKRWSAWYDGNFSRTIGQDLDTITSSGIPLVSGLGSMNSSVFEFGGFYDDTGTDLTRPGTDWEHFKLYTSFLKTWAREMSPGTTEWQEYTASPAKFKAPMYFETKVNFSKMNTPGFRLSMWLMPATYDQLGAQLATNAEAYDGNFKNGFEIDIFEYEPWTPECGDLLEFSWINSFSTRGKAGRSANGKNHFEGPEESGYADPGSIKDAWHTIGLLWDTDKIQWILNGDVVLEITDDSMIPDIYQYLIVSREMTNGLTSGDEEYDGGSDFLPPEGGLYGWNGGSNVGDYLGNVNDDKAQIDYIRIYTPYTP